MNENIARNDISQGSCPESGCCSKRGQCPAPSPYGRSFHPQDSITFCGWLFDPQQTVWITLCTLALVTQQVQNSWLLCCSSTAKILFPICLLTAFEWVTSATGKSNILSSGLLTNAIFPDKCCLELFLTLICDGVDIFFSIAFYYF